MDEPGQKLRARPPQANRCKRQPRVGAPRAGHCPALGGLVGVCWGMRLRWSFGEDLLGGWGKIAHVREQRHELPELLIAEHIFPAGHASPANAVLQNEKIMIFVHVWLVIHE